MPRLIAFFLLFGLAFWVAILATGTGTSRPRDPRTYRPRGRWGGDRDGASSASRGTMHVVKRSELDGLRDAYSSAPIDAAKPLLRCGGCQALYHVESVAALDRENHGRCTVCGGSDLAAVHVVGD